MGSQAGWCSLQLAKACIVRDAEMVATLAPMLGTQFDDKSIRKIWHKAKLSLTPLEIEWFKNQLVIIVD